MERCRWYSITGREEILQVGEALDRRSAARALLRELFSAGPRVPGATRLRGVSAERPAHEDYVVDDGVFEVWFRVSERDCDVIIVMVLPSELQDV